VDPDAPEREGDGSAPGKRGPWLHWLVTACAGTSEDAFCISDYMPPAPAIGNHRYMFILCRGEVAKKKSDERASPAPAAPPLRPLTKTAC